MCKMDAIEVTREERPAWDATVASFQRTLRCRLQLIRTSAMDGAEELLGTPGADLAAAED